MPSFKLERKIPPSEVTLDLLKQLEKVMLDDIASQSKPLSIEELKERSMATIFSGGQPTYSIAITDSFGTETLQTISEYRPLLLPDTTHSVVIEFATPYGSLPLINIMIVFHLNNKHSAFRIAATGESAREVARGIEDRLLQILAPQRRFHGFLHLSFAGQCVLFMVFSGLVALLYALHRSVPTISENRGPIPLATPPTILENVLSYISPIIPIIVAMLFVFWIASIAYAFAQDSRPYIIFESQRNNRRASVWKWLLPAVATFVVFATIVVAFRRSWLGW